jgi:hypothetical protein
MDEPAVKVALLDVLITVHEGDVETLRHPPAGTAFFFTQVPERPPLDAGDMVFLKYREARIAQATVHRVQACAGCAAWMIFWRPASVQWLN